MFIPLRTDRPPRRRPIVTEGLIILNMLVYLAGLVGPALELFDREALARAGQLNPLAPEVWTLVSYQFLHDPHGIFHLAFNMLFLWVFGAPVEDRLGRVGFIGFYLIGGTVAALAHMMVSQAPIIGASGSIAAVTGAFLALFPRSRIRMLIFIMLMDLPAVLVIAIFFALDCVRQTTELLGLGGSHVAYMAHIAGYIYGFAMGFALLGLGILKHEEFDVFYLFRQARRRAAFRAAGRQQAGGLWDSASADTGEQLARKRRRNTGVPEPDRRLLELRAEINRLAFDHKLAEAATLYRKLLEDDPGAVLSEERQLDLGNQLYAEGDHALAARAYELLLSHYRSSPSVAEVSLILGLLYTRQLDRPGRAAELLETARKRLRDPAQLELADQLLAELAA